MQFLCWLFSRTSDATIAYYFQNDHILADVVNVDMFGVMILFPPHIGGFNGHCWVLRLYRFTLSSPSSFQFNPGRLMKQEIRKQPLQYYSSNLKNTIILHGRVSCACAQWTISHYTKEQCYHQKHHAPNWRGTTSQPCRSILLILNVVLCIPLCSTSSVDCWICSRWRWIFITSIASSPGCIR